MKKPIYIRASIIGLPFVWAVSCSPVIDAVSGRSAEFMKPCPLTSAGIATECISAHRVDAIDYSEVIDGSTQVLVFGETHFTDAHRNELIRALPELKKLGFGHLALEAMPSSKQDLVADYMRGRLTRVEFIAAIKSTWGHKPESYVQLIDAALAENIEVVFLDSDKEPSARPIDVKAPNWQELEEQAREMRRQDRSRREEHWMNVLSALLRRDQNSRVIMLVGSNHTATSAVTAPVPLRLSARNIRSTTIALEGGDVFIDSVFAEAARHANIQWRRFIVRIAPGDPNAEGDFHLHLPQTDSRNIIGKRD
jgi:hypothetical protein